MKKNIFKIIGILILGLFLISCGAKKDESSSNGNSTGTTAQETEKIKVKVGTEGVFAPFTFTDDSGKLTGYDIEVMEEIGKRANLDIEFVPTPWDSMFLGLESKKFDVIANQIAKNPEREQKYDFSDGYLISKAQIIVKNGRKDIQTLNDLKGKRVPIAVGSNYSEIIMKSDSNNEINYVYYDGNATIALDEIVTGKADATVHDALTAGYYNQQRGSELVELVGEPLNAISVHLTFRKDTPELRERIDKALAEIKADGTLAKISEKWFTKDFTK